MPVVARVAASLGLPGNPVEAVDTARSKLRTRQASERARPAHSQDHSASDRSTSSTPPRRRSGSPSVVKPEFGAPPSGPSGSTPSSRYPDIYWIVRKELESPQIIDFRAGNDLLLEEYLDGVEFDIDLVLEDGECMFSSVSQNWPTAEPSFQETGLHCPPDHRAKPVGQLVELAVKTVQAFGFSRGVLHVEGKCTAKGPRIVEVNARLGGGRIHQIVDAVWGVDLVEAQLQLGPRVAPAAHAEPEAAMRRRERDRVRAGNRPASSAAVHRRDIGGRPGRHHRRRG